jgi:PPOX class probable F420-dependent enzyme
MTTPEIPDSHKALLDAQIAVLGTVGASGRPQLSAVWFLAEGDTIKLSLSDSRQKTKNLLADPHVSLLIFDPASPYRYLELRGDAELTEDGDYAFADQVGAKYGGADLREHDHPGDVRMVVTIKPTRVVTWG